MKIIKPYFEIETKIDGEAILCHIEKMGRIAYKSESCSNSFQETKDFVQRIIKRGHESVLEHVSITVRFVCDRGVTHEIVRHRIASYTQESTRYCNYANDKFGKEITVIQPLYIEDNPINYTTWKFAMEAAEKAYLALIAEGISPQMARSVLPNSLKTEIGVTMNLREWRHFFKLHTALDAHPQMREITIPMLLEFQKRIPIIFDDI
jgi:thymidylate synthase (FAD)